MSRADNCQSHINQISLFPLQQNDVLNKLFTADVMLFLLTVAALLATSGFAVCHWNSPSVVRLLKRTKTITRDMDQTVHSCLHASRGVHLEPVETTVASIHQQHVEASLSCVLGIPTTSVGRTHRGDRWRTVPESQYTHAHSDADSCAETAACETWRDEMFVLEDTRSLRVRVGGAGFMCLTGALHGRVCPSHVQQP